MAEVRNIAWFYRPEETTPTPNYAEMAKYSPMILDKGDESTITALRGAPYNYTPPIWAYVRGEAIQQKAVGSQPARNQVAWTTNDWDDGVGGGITNAHPDWFLLDTNGNRMLAKQGVDDYWMMDPASAGWRTFFVTRINQLIAEGNFAGIFMDNIEASFVKRQQEGNIFPQAYATAALYVAAIAAFCAYVKANITPGNPVLGNIINVSPEANYATLVNSMDGGFTESSFVDYHTGWRSASQWLDHKNRAIGGKKTIYVSQFDDPNDQVREQFSFCSYLMVAGTDVSFRHATASNYNHSYWYANYDTVLGQPTGVATQSGTAWSRPFENGTVTVDPTLHTSSINISQDGPVVKSTYTGNVNVDNLNHVITLSNVVGEIGLGDRILVFWCNDGTSTITVPPEFTLIGTTFAALGRFSIFDRVVDGTESWFAANPAQITVTTSAVQESAWIVKRIERHLGSHALSSGGAAATGNSTAPDPPSLTSSGGQVLYFACAFWLDGTANCTSGPSGFTNLTTSQSANATGVGVAVAQSNINTSPVDAGAFTLSSAKNWAARSIGVWPGSDGTISEGSRGWITVARHILRKR